MYCTDFGTAEDRLEITSSNYLGPVRAADPIENGLGLMEVWRALSCLGLLLLQASLRLLDFS